MRRIVLVLAFLLAASIASAQNVTNPQWVEFVVSSDHQQVTTYVLGIYQPGGTVLVAEIDLGKPTPDAAGKALVQWNAQPLSFAKDYVAKVRAVVGTGASSVSSEWSGTSNPFDRVPGKPGDPNVVKK